MSALSPQAQKILMKAYNLRNEGKIDASLKQAKSVAKKHPDDIHVTYLLGSLYNEKKNYSLAQKNFSIGISKDRNGHINQGGLGAVYFRMGEHEKALELLTLAHSRAPKEYSHINNLGQLYFAMGDTDKSAELLDIAFTMNPADIEIADILSTIYVKKENYNRAQKILMIAASKNPDDIEIQSILASFYESRTLLEPATTLNKKVLEKDPDHFRAHFSLYNIYSQEGDIEKAKEHLKEMVRIDPTNIDALSASFQLKAQEEIFGDNLNKALEFSKSLVLDDTKLSNLDHGSLFGLSSIMESQNEFSTAFKALKLANDKKKAENEFYGMTFDKNHFKKYVEYLKDFNNWDQLLDSADYQDDRMVFIAALPRSGTTLMEQILAAHPECDGIGESENLDKLKAEVAGKLIKFPPSIEWPAHFMARSEEDKIQLSKTFMKNSEDLIENKTAKKIVEKSIGNFMYIGLLAAILPKAKFIFAKRNRAASGLSIYQQSFANQFLFDNDLDDINFMFDILDELMDFWQSLFGDRILTVDYENLVTDTENQAKLIISHIGLDWDPACLEFYKNKRQIKTASLHQARNKVYSSSAERYLNYKDYLSPLLGS
ncbi:sulfotransferase family protein [Rhodospirillaceae bacterium RKSG073]|nr:sulfotransferase family protein [Curvivirga aplysinae]